MSSILLDLMVGSAAKQAEYTALKFGKSKEQKQYIDFFAKLAGVKTGCLSKVKSKMTVQEYENKVMERCNSLNVKQRAIQRIGIDESEISEINPILLHAFDFDDKDALVGIKDGVAVSSLYEVTWLFFSQTEIYAYSLQFDMTSDEIFEQTREYFYQDIVSFETYNHLVENIRKKIGCGCFGKEKPIKDNYVVDSFKLTVPGDSFSVSMRGSGNQFESIMAAKAMLREKKFMK